MPVQMLYFLFVEVIKMLNKQRDSRWECEFEAMWFIKIRCTLRGSVYLNFWCLYLKYQHNTTFLLVYFLAHKILRKSNQLYVSNRRPNMHYKYRFIPWWVWKLHFPQLYIFILFQHLWSNIYVHRVPHCNISLNQATHIFLEKIFATPKAGRLSQIRSEGVWRNELTSSGYQRRYVQKRVKNVRPVYWRGRHELLGVAY